MAFFPPSDPQPSANSGFLSSVHHCNTPNESFGAEKQPVKTSLLGGSKQVTLLTSEQQDACRRRHKQLQKDFLSTGDVEKKLRILLEIRKLELGTVRSDSEIRNIELQKLRGRYSKLQKEHVKVAKQANRAMRLVNDLYFEKESPAHNAMQAVPKQELAFYKKIEKDYSELELDFLELCEEKDALASRVDLLEEENKILREQLKQQEAKRNKDVKKRKAKEARGGGNGGDIKKARYDQSALKDKDLLKEEPHSVQQDPFVEE